MVVRTADGDVLLPHLSALPHALVPQLQAWAGGGEEASGEGETSPPGDDPSSSRNG